MFRANSNDAGSLNYGLFNDELPTREEGTESISENSPTIAFTLPVWINAESHTKSYYTGQNLLDVERFSLIRRVLVAYAIGKVLEHLAVSVSSYSQPELEKLCSIDNFSIHMSSDFKANLVGVEMISPPIFVCIKAGQFFANEDEDDWGINAEAIITRHCAFCCATKPVHQDEEENDDLLCHAFGLLLYNLFSGERFTEASLKPSSYRDELEYGQNRPHKL